MGHHACFSAPHMEQKNQQKVSNLIKEGNLTNLKNIDLILLADPASGSSCVDVHSPDIVAGLKKKKRGITT